MSGWVWFGDGIGIAVDDWQPGSQDESGNGPRARSTPQPGCGSAATVRALQRRTSRPEPRRRLTWPDGAPRIGIHLGVATGLMKAARRARQIGATALQIFSDNPTAWRRRPEPPADATDFVAYLAAQEIAPIAIHASYLINLAGRAEPFASQSRRGPALRDAARPGLRRAVREHAHRLAPWRRARYGHRPANRQRQRGPGRVRRPALWLVLENSSGGGDTLGGTIEELAEILEGIEPSHGSPAGLLPRYGAPVGSRLRHLDNLGRHVSAGSLRRADRPGPAGAGAPERLALGARHPQRPTRAPRRREDRSGGAGGLPARSAARGRHRVRDGDAGRGRGLRRGQHAAGRLLYGGATTLPELPPKAFRTSRRSTRTGIGSIRAPPSAATGHERGPGGQYPGLTRGRRGQERRPVPAIL